MTRQTAVSVLLSILALVAGVVGFGKLASLKPEIRTREIQEPVYNAEVFRVRRRNLQEIVSAFGTAQADREVVLSAQVAGEVVELRPDLRIGAALRPGGASQSSPVDVLVKIDRESYQRRYDQLAAVIAEDEAELDRLAREKQNNELLYQNAQEDLKTYREEFERVLALREKGAGSVSAVNQARLELQRYQTVLVRARNDLDLYPQRKAQAERRKESHEAELRIAALDLQRTEVIPPFPGTISEVMVEWGQYVRVGDPLIRLTDTSRVEIPVAVTLADHRRLSRAIARGDWPRVELAVNQTAAARWQGQIRRVAPEIDELTRTAMVYVEVENDGSDDPLLPGTFVHARVEGPVMRQAVVIPRDALIDGHVIVAGHDGRAKLQEVRVSRLLQSLAVVESGLLEGSRVVMTNLDVLRAEFNVTAIPAESTPEASVTRVVQPPRVQVQAEHSLEDELRRHHMHIVRPLPPVPAVTDGRPSAVGSSPRE